MSLYSHISAPKTKSNIMHEITIALGQPTTCFQNDTLTYVDWIMTLLLAIKAVIIAVDNPNDGYEHIPCRVSPKGHGKAKRPNVKPNADWKARNLDQYKKFL